MFEVGDRIVSDFSGLMTALDGGSPRDTIEAGATGTIIAIHAGDCVGIQFDNGKSGRFGTWNLKSAAEHDRKAVAARLKDHAEYYSAITGES